MLDHVFNRLGVLAGRRAVLLEEGGVTVLGVLSGAVRVDTGVVDLGVLALVGLVNKDNIGTLLRGAKSRSESVRMRAPNTKVTHLVASGLLGSSNPGHLEGDLVTSLEVGRGKVGSGDTGLSGRRNLGLVADGSELGVLVQLVALGELLVGLDESELEVRGVLGREEGHVSVLCLSERM